MAETISVAALAVRNAPKADNVQLHNKPKTFMATYKVMVAKATTFSTNEKIESVKMQFVNDDADKKPAAIETYIKGTSGLGKNKVKVTSDEISFSCASCVAQLSNLNKDIAGLRDCGYLTSVDFSAILTGAKITLDCRSVKAGDPKVDWRGKPVYKRSEDGLILLNEQLKPIQAVHENDAEIKDIVALQLTEDAVQYLNRETKNRKSRNESIELDTAKITKLVPELARLIKSSDKTGISEHQAVLEAIEMALKHR